MIQCCGNEYPDEDIELHKLSMLHKKIHGKPKQNARPVVTVPVLDWAGIEEVGLIDDNAR